MALVVQYPSGEILQCSGAMSGEEHIAPHCLAIAQSAAALLEGEGGGLERMTITFGRKAYILAFSPTAVHVTKA